MKFDIEINNDELLKIVWILFIFKMLIIIGRAQQQGDEIS
jgi:hypothetical protein